MAQVTWTPQALDDLEAICWFIARDAPAYAGLFADRAFVASEQLQQFPRLGRVVPEFGLRKFESLLCKATGSSTACDWMKLKF